MNKTKILLLALCAVELTGCGEQTSEQRDTEIASHITEFCYKGHRYLKYERDGGFGHYERGYAGITHDPDCPCREKGGEDD